jgi:hypothetical protein
MRAGLRDFSDRLSPMLVKELRQGLKSPVFIWGLILMQLALALMALVTMDEGNSSDSSLAFWWSGAIVVCILLPMRVANALRDEMGGNTMDTLVLTRLSAWRITLGKWLATGALQILVAITVLPYLILRYFAGGVDTPAEIAWMGGLVVFGLLVTAIMLGLSWFRYFLVRAFVMLVVIFGAAMGCAALILMVTRGADYVMEREFIGIGWSGFVWLLLLTGWLAYFFLDLGVAQIAPAAENRATRRRLSALVFCVAAGACCLMTKKPEGGLLLGVLSFGVLIAACVQALCERPSNFAPILKPFVKRGLAGRLAGRLLYPGWHTGVFYSFVLFVSGATLFSLLMRFAFSTRYYDSTEFVAPVVSVFAGIYGLIILPVILWRLFQLMHRWNFWRWLMLVMVAGLLHGAILIGASKSDGSGARLNLLLPSGGLLVPVIAEMERKEEWRQQGPDSWDRGNNWDDMERRERQIMSLLAVAACVSLALWGALAFIFALIELRKTREAEDELAAALDWKNRTAGA